MKILGIDHVYTQDAPEPGAYSQGVLYDPSWDKLLFIAGQTGNDPSLPDQPVVVGGVGPQTTQALKNIDAVLKSVGADFRRLVSVDVFLKDSGDTITRQNDWRQYNEAYKKFFAEHGVTDNKFMPARMQVWVADVPWAIEDTLVEIRAVAAISRA